MPKVKSKKQTHAENLKRATKVAQNTLYILIALTVVKALAGYFTNIVTLFGDAMGSFTDIISIVAIILGLKLSQKNPSKRFKYGFHRIETFITLLISIFIIFAGYKILRVSIDRFFTREETALHFIGIITASASILTSLFASFYQRKIAVRINSTALLASAHDKFNDAFVSISVLISVITDKFNIPYVESIIGMLLSLTTLWIGFKYGKEALLYLLDYWDNPKITNQIKEILQKSKIVTAVKNIRLRHVGTYIFGEAFLAVNPFTSSKDLRDEIHRLDKNIEDSVEHLGDLVLYIDPPKPTAINVALPIVRENGLKSEIASDPSIPLKFLLVEIRNNNIKKYSTAQETFKIDDVAPIAKFLAKKRVNILVSGMIGPLLYYNLRLKNIKVYPHFPSVVDAENTLKLLMLDI